MSFHHTQAGLASWGCRTMRATGCAAALLLALTGCFGGSQSENSSSSPSPSSTANHSQYPLPSSTASPTKKTEPTVTETQVSAPAESAEAKASESSAPAEAKATSATVANPTAGERCGHIGRKGYLKTGNGAVGRTFAGPVEVTRMNFLTGASEVNTVNESSALHAETTTANTKTMHALDVVTVPAAEGKQLTCFGEMETGSISCHDGNGPLLRWAAGTKAKHPRQSQ